MDSFSPLFLSLLIVFASFVLYHFHKRMNYLSKLPPGTTGLPIIGETMEYSSSGPEKFIENRMEKYSESVFRTSLLGEKMAVFCGPASNKFLLSNENKILATWWPEAFVMPLIYPPPEGTTLKEATYMNRSLIQEFLRPESLKQCIPIMDSMSRKHLDTHCAPFQEVRIYPLSKKVTFSIACRLFLGLEDLKLVHSLRGSFDLFKSLMISVPIDLPGTAYNKAMRVGKIVKDEIVKIITQKKMEVQLPVERDTIESFDLLSYILFQSKSTSSMTEKDICNILTTVLLATYVDTSAAVTFVLRYLAELPHIYNEVYKECMNISSSKVGQELLNWNDIQNMKYTWNVAREVLRLMPPSPGTFREVTTDLTYAGFTVPKGWKTFWSVYSTHKNPKYFSNPEKFDPSRFEGNGPAPYTFVPFGFGSRICPGREFARLEILVFTYNVITTFKLQKLDQNEKVKHHVTPFPEHGFPVRLIPHKK